MTKVVDLVGEDLDRMVALCRFSKDYDMSVPYSDDGKVFSPSSDWHHGGPIIEWECIYLMPGCGTTASIGQWEARIDDPDGEPWTAVGPTPLIAAMRCYVASLLGADYEVPSIVPQQA